ncbi:hypothetical protein [Paraburkholderia caffeinilytica]
MAMVDNERPALFCMLGVFNEEASDRTGPTLGVSAGIVVIRT